MDVLDILKTCTGDSSMDMIAIMMQMQKFPELCEPFYNFPENDLFPGTSLTATSPVFSPGAITPPAFINPQPSPSPSPSPPNFVNNIPLQQPMTPPIQPNPSFSEKKNSVAAMREMIFRVAVMQPIHIDPESIKPPKRRNVKISKDPQSVAARHRRERISERIRILQRLVPGGTKMDTASMLDEAIHYVKFLKKQVQSLEQAGANTPFNTVAFPLVSNANVTYSAFLKTCQPSQMLPSSASKQMLS